MRLTIILAIVLQVSIQEILPIEIKSCVDKGRYYAEGDTIPDPDPCAECRCYNIGRKICAMRDCFVPTCPGRVAPIRKQGQCCPSCPPSLSSPPIDCSLVQCAQPMCGPGIGPIFKPENCCPSCPPKGCVDNEKLFVEGDTMPDPDPCAVCRCTSTGKLCALSMCVMPTCPGGAAPIKKIGQCCHSCPPSPPIVSGCNVNSKIYAEGEIVRDSSKPCSTCRCTRGQVTCAPRVCTPTQCRYPVHPRGQCCQICPNDTNRGY